MLTRTSHYALRAMVYLAQHADDWPLTGRQIAEAADIPANYLSKVMGDLVRAGVLESSRGIGGGFRMSRPPDQVSLFEVLAPFEQMLTTERPCPFGNRECSDQDPCFGHDGWKRVLETYRGYLQRTSIRDVAMKRRARARSPA